MRKINCDCCDKKTENYITYVHTYDMFYLTGDRHPLVMNLINVALSLCKKCYKDVKKGIKKPKPIDKVIDIAWITGYE